MSFKQHIKVHEKNALNGFLLVRPVWVDDETVKTCKNCRTSFTPIRRKHHCRQCGNIFCQECTSRSIALPQFGYVKPERVCSGCIEIAYLVGYVVSDDNSTQLHGARGLLDIVERGNEQELLNFINYGGLDALVYLCRTSQESDLQSLKPYIIMKGGLPYLYNLVLFYYDKVGPESSDISITEKYLDSVSSIILNIGNILYYLSISGSLCQRMLPDNASLDAILKLASFQFVELTQGLASKTLSCLAINPSHQLLIIESSIEGLDRLINLLLSNIYEVRKYAAKSIAYLSLRNDKYKSALIKDGRAETIASIINVEDEESAKADQVTISHTCCAMANLATNEIQRHIARLLANFALYDENKIRMLSYQIISIDDEVNNQTEESWGSVIPTLIAIGDSPVSNVEIQRHIIRAIDNLSTEVPSGSHSKLTPCIPLINRILDTVKDEDIQREKVEKGLSVPQLPPIKKHSNGKNLLKVFPNDHNLVSIPGWTIVDGMFGLNKHVSYQIVYRYWDNGNITKILINKRYNDFYQFHQSLIRKYGKDIILYLPPKQREGRFIPRFIECRRERLQLYLSRMAVTNPNEFMDFLGHNETNRTRIESDGGPRIMNQNIINNGSAVPTRSCLAINTTSRCQKKQVKFEKEVVNNEKASRNPRNNLE
ncbi:1621_t:CDS:10 [Diversispora eburnea]|uniref:1621_t:CDS:1 n=1 Tax=Diversispora eburnea TaxID=1213867 RepID=A0A9N9FEF5_9GLOM|nr:1621_t:CDS:10 [Diversispora eburnea]